MLVIIAVAISVGIVSVLNPIIGGAIALSLGVAAALVVLVKRARR